MSEKLKYALYNGLFSTLAMLPSSMLYAVASGIRWAMENVAGYRRKTIRQNLRNSFPDATEEELRAYEHDFYSQLADNIVETVKLLRISDSEVDRRIKFVGTEAIDEAAAAGHPIILYLGHYANWEFVPAITRCLKVPKICAQVYKPLRDKAFDRLMLKVRSRFNPVSLPQHKVLRALLGWHRDDTNFICGFIADHRSNSKVAHHNTTFLNQSTNFNPGGEEIGSRINAAYFYMDAEKPSRGHYVFTARPIVPRDTDVDYPYTREYLRMLEQSIRRRPGLWLWSHRRWKWENRAAEEAARKAENDKADNDRTNISKSENS